MAPVARCGHGTAKTRNVQGHVEKQSDLRLRREVVCCHSKDPHLRKNLPGVETVRLWNVDVHGMSTGCHDDHRYDRKATDDEIDSAIEKVLGRAGTLEMFKDARLFPQVTGRWVL